jgi:exportin-5
MSNLGNFVEEKANLFTPKQDLDAFLKLLLSITQNPSLTVSIPALNSWVKLLRGEVTGAAPPVLMHAGSLLELCSSRLLHYETVPRDSQDPAVIFLYEDLETYPERHAFVGNYRRFCMYIIEVIVRRNPAGAIPHILENVDRNLATLYADEPPFSGEFLDPCLRREFRG